MRFWYGELDWIDIYSVLGWTYRWQWWRWITIWACELEMYFWTNIRWQLMITLSIHLHRVMIGMHPQANRSRPWSWILPVKNDSWCRCVQVEVTYNHAAPLSSSVSALDSGLIAIVSHVPQSSLVSCYLLGMNDLSSNPRRLGLFNRGVSWSLPTSMLSFISSWPGDKERLCWFLRCWIAVVRWAFVTGLSWLIVRNTGIACSTVVLDARVLHIINRLSSSLI